ncbi:hypothetical protein G6F46_004003 [Rhizopus delemar]|uniref:Uncharacterized protein n=2 Tax=Rhizopus TaxID=4842 RepID=A0A9P7CRL4_9FUNG|nr:hypothetical protein G6F55_002808 [Rhizopus delemar]KAG1547512.1 hypothetical protein G6F51_004226 [Rhizopus arrhizus]KAG1500872.1 hypothetical protein G6F54_003425 [Rhizopus delemar]KAG1514434.1 hypothetical protein G6F53_003681 [Rhizopus delemar]KAG1527489.1 hypothetical protein G6F52_001487 [Rhizopus delemar]
MSITRTKEKLAEAISIYERLSQNIKNDPLISTLNDEDWAKHLRILGHDAAKLIQLSRLLDNEGLIRVLSDKQKKLKRHKLWKKRVKKKARHQQLLTEKRSKQWVKEMEWKVITAKPVVEKSEKEEDKEAKAKIKELSKTLTKLTQLRDLRRKKLENKGHFFADDGNDFFNKVKEWNEQQQQQQQQEREKEEEEGKKEIEQVKELVVDKQDKWKDMEIEKTPYAYWCESNQSIDALLRIRRLWDQYIINDDVIDERDPRGKIPPTFVTPSPPANWVWATCLL